MYLIVTLIPMKVKYRDKLFLQVLVRKKILAQVVEVRKLEKKKVENLKMSKPLTIAQRYHLCRYT